MGYEIANNAREVAKTGPRGNVVLSHAKLRLDDIEWLKDISEICFWNVHVPLGLLSQMKALVELTWTGGSVKNVPGLASGECPNLHRLDISHVRGLADMSFLPSLENLALLSLYAQKQILELPSLRSMEKLRRVELGQLKRLSTLLPVLDAPALEDLILVKTVPIDLTVADKINAHKSLLGFSWHWEDVPVKVAEPVIDRIALPKPIHSFKDQWLGRWPNGDNE